MKVSSSRPISSPGRNDKFPPPLMRFLRSNVGSKSRGRTSRSSPLMFVRKKSTAIETQEPSSPKVTCMGQVRVTRSSKQIPKNGRPQSPTTCHCHWLAHALFCFHHTNRKTNPNPIQKRKHSRPAWPKWVGFFRRKSQTKQDFAKTETLSEHKNDYYSDQQEEEDDDEDDNYGVRVRVRAEAFVSDFASPPKNALLLTRCRSAPYRSSSLAGRFWGSPETERTEEEREKEAESETPTWERESISNTEVRVDPKFDEKMRLFRELEGSIRERFINSEWENGQLIIRRRRRRRKVNEREDSALPLILTRCKSEPARTGEKLDPEADSWRSGFRNSHSPYIL